MNAAGAALAYVRPGMKLGLGTGSTAAHFVDLLGQRVMDGFDVMAVATSTATEDQARQLDIPLISLEEAGTLDLCIDGADEADDQGRLIKGGGGALLREKMVANMAKNFIVIADDSKRVETLGGFDLPVEVVPFAWQVTAGLISRACFANARGGQVHLRLDKLMQDEPFITDNGNYIIDCKVEKITDAEKLALTLSQIPGVVEHGIFIAMATRLIFGSRTSATEIEL